MKSRLILFWMLCLLSVSLFAQPLINNGSFELGNRTPDECKFPVSDYSLYNIDYWEQAQENPQCVYSNATPPITMHCGSPDWIDMSKCSSNPLFMTNNFPPPNTPSNAKFIGFAANNSNDQREAIRTKLNAQLAKGNILRIKLRMANSKAVYSPGSIDNNVWFKICFTKFGEHWNSDPLTTANVVWAMEPLEFKIQPNDPHVWYTREFYVTIPDQVKGGNISEVENMIIAAYGDNDSYFFLDDLEVFQQDPCNGACTPSEARDTMEFQVISNPVQPWHKITGSQNIDLNQAFAMKSSDRLPFAINMKNVTYAEVRLVDGYGGIHNVLNIKNVNVLGSDDTLGFYQMWYWGIFQDETPVPTGVYDMEISLFNCKFKKNTTIYCQLIIHNGGIPSPRPPDEDWITVFSNCCPVNATYNNISFFTPFQQSVETYIHAGTTGTTTVEPSASVKFVAYDEIKLGTYWQVKQGATFSAFLAPCGFGKNGQPKPTKKIFSAIQIPNSESQIVITPNPTYESSFTMEFFNDGLESNKLVQVRNMLGNVVYSQRINFKGGKVSHHVVLDNSLSAGVYFAEVIGSKQVLRTKFVIQ